MFKDYFLTGTVGYVRLAIVSRESALIYGARMGSLATDCVEEPWA
jgi:hypothetical protein